MNNESERAAFDSEVGSVIADAATRGIAWMSFKAGVVFARAASANETGAEGAPIPAGYALVPIEPTEEMKLSALKADDRDREPRDQLLVQWDAMLSAVPPTVTEAAISAAARVLSDSNADLCYVDRDDNWKIHGDEFRVEARAVLEAALAPTEQPAQADAPAEARSLPMMRKAFRVTEVSGDPDPAKQSFAMRFSFPSIEALHAADGEWRKFIAAAQADARVGLRDDSPPFFWRRILSILNQQGITWTDAGWRFGSDDHLYRFAVALLQGANHAE